MTNNNDLLQESIALIKNGQKQRARVLLQKIIQQEPQNEKAWLWLSATVDKNEQKIYCLKKVLEINPNNQSAINGIKKLSEQGDKSLAGSTTRQAPIATGGNPKKKSKGLEIAVIGGLSSLLVCVVFLAIFFFAYQGNRFEKFTLVPLSGITPSESPSSTPTKITITETATSTFTPSPIPTNRPTFTPYPTNTPLPTIAPILGRFTSPYRIGDSVTLPIIPEEYRKPNTKGLGEIEIKVLDVKSGNQANELA
jgi:hypothetical protein